MLLTCWPFCSQNQLQSLTNHKPTAVVLYNGRKVMCTLQYGRVQLNWKPKCKAKHFRYLMWFTVKICGSFAQPCMWFCCVLHTSTSQLFLFIHGNSGCFPRGEPAGTVVSPSLNDPYAGENSKGFLTATGSLTSPPIDHSQGILTGSGHKRNRDWKRGLAVYTMVQTTNSPHTLTIGCTQGLASNLTTSYDPAH